MKEMGEYMRGHSSGKHGCHGYGSYRAFWDDNLRLTIGGFVVAANYSQGQREGSLRNGEDIESS